MRALFLREDFKKKPIWSLVFGSSASGSYKNKSDIDVLYVFNKIEKDIDEKAKVFASRYNVKLEPVYLIWQEFRKKLFD